MGQEAPKTEMRGMPQAYSQQDLLQIQRKPTWAKAFVRNSSNQVPLVDINWIASLGDALA
ncbi:uncharacterized protein PITG_18085 [Phytophthora infestans T30-4]|uniref:Uncharacterized protein n=1 Tax=Phytophthora infestans (strain T30-4) TaxID=403677 RepID=D0NY58_PHYIT|nr:uncharacterized protein PITG_18085 [Phytophthora infestans T30-4]EEY68016.1 hypothetical protein PITG_18085 [Phytophthora infestans T30-4]|eukprot:XP_002997715.1 hypothetical protein PITG_18085 [Phytophthora infestans T30-4]